MSLFPVSGGKIVRVLIVDDEALARQRLEDLLRDQPNVELVGTADNGEAAITAIRTLEPDAFRAAISHRYRPRRAQVTTEYYLTDTAAQTVVNSRIAQRKFDLFDRGVLFVYFALCFLMLPLTVALLRASLH